MQIKQIVLLIGALIDTYFYANKRLFSYLSMLRLFRLLQSSTDASGIAIW